jgi:hypothetical protein
MNKMIKSVKKKTLVILCIVALAATIGLTTAITTWSQTITWSYSSTPPANPSFTISNSTTLDLGAILDSATKTATYTITNNGNVPITVNATATPTGAVIPTWDKTSALIAVGASKTFTLTLVITGIGSCTVNFAKA